jgi:SAM-dependent methyltransferase
LGSGLALAGVLWAYPAIKRYLLKKCPAISGFVERVISQYGEVGSPDELALFEDTLVWTIADLLVYNKCPEVYDSLDGTLHSLPLPDNFADVFITSHALGWYLDEELPEFERVVKPGGTIVHCPGTAASAGNDTTHTALISPEWSYNVAKYQEPDGIKRKYWKQVL